MEPIINRVAQSNLHVFNLEDLWDGNPVVEFDLAPYLWQGLVLKEKDFRAAMSTHDWAAYQDQHVAVFCSTDAILPTWAFMLVTTALHTYAASVTQGRKDDLIRDYFVRALAEVDWQTYTDEIVIIKGCASDIVPPNAYLLATAHLQNVARKIMYGEPCSSVPLWRKPKPHVV